MSGRIVAMRVVSIKQARSENLDLRGRSLEVTGLGIIAALIFAFWSLVTMARCPFPTISCLSRSSW
jgi:hypothetical protein